MIFVEYEKPPQKKDRNAFNAIQLPKYAYENFKAASSAWNKSMPESITVCTRILDSMRTMYLHDPSLTLEYVVEDYMKLKLTQNSIAMLVLENDLLNQQLKSIKEESRMLQIQCKEQQNDIHRIKSQNVTLESSTKQLKATIAALNNVNAGTNK